MAVTCECGSERIAEVSGKCSDQCSIQLGDFSRDDYVPSDMGIGGGDYLNFSYCLDCGRIQGTFPLDQTELEETELDPDGDEYLMDDEAEMALDKERRYGD